MATSIASRLNSFCRRLACFCAPAVPFFGAVAAAQGLEFTKAAVAGKSATVCRVEIKKDAPQLFLLNTVGQPLKTFDALNASLRPGGRRLAFAMNAGMYHPGCLPVGLFVAGGKEMFPLNLRPGQDNFFLKPNGVFAVTPAGACVVESSRYPALPGPVTLATQSGPLLVSGGKFHPAFNAGSTSRLYRNGVGVPSPDVALFVITDEPMNFYEFATLFRNVLHCPDALFLDGTISSLCAPSLRRNDFRMDLGPIIGVTEPTPRPGRP